MFGFRFSGGAIALALLCMPSPIAAGVRVQPMSYDLLPTGDASKQDLRVENTSATPSAVEVRVERREILPDGSDKRTPANDDFIVFPPQATIPANGFQTFRVQYIGDPKLAATRLYSITIAQLPVNGEGGATTGVQIVYNIGTLAAVSPANSQPKLVITAVAPATVDGKLQITVENEGNRYARLRDGVWTLTSTTGQTEKVEGQVLRSAIDNSLIEPGKTRVITLPVSPTFVRAGATAKFELSSSR